MTRTGLQRKRAWFQAGFFMLFVMAPVLDLFRLDLNLGHFILFGQHWTLGIDDIIAGTGNGFDFAINVMTRAFIPLLLVAGGLIFTAWRWGRLYCGWLCPHFSVVEVINRLMVRASGKPSIWEHKQLPLQQPDGSVELPDRRFWLPTVIAIIGFAFLWAISLLTYLLPPAEIYGNLVTGELTRNQAIFLIVATLLLSIEFGFARHLFCRFGCAVGLFQSLAWMGNDKAMVVGFDTGRAFACNSCNNACDNACPMRLRPRTLKRKMFTCTECGECISACTKVQSVEQQQGLLRWVEGEDALKVVTGRTPVTDQQARGTASQQPLKE